MQKTKFLEIKEVISLVALAFKAGFQSVYVVWVHGEGRSSAGDCSVVVWEMISQWYQRS